MRLVRLIGNRSYVSVVLVACSSAICDSTRPATRTGIEQIVTATPRNRPPTDAYSENPEPRR